MKKLMALIMAILMLVCSFDFTACDKDETPNDDGKQNDTENKDDGEIDGELELGDIIDIDAKLEIPEDAKDICDGHTFTIFAPAPYGPKTFYVESLNDTPKNDAIYNRNLALQDTLGVTIEAIDLDVDAGRQSTKFIDDVLAGDHSFDLAAVHTTSACAALVMSNTVLPFEELEYVDFSKPWWNTGINETCSIMDRNFFALSAACNGYYSNTSCILFNKDLAQEADLPNLYDIVRKDEWTIDKMIQLTKNFSQDLNNDGLYDADDKLAVISDDVAYMNFWLGACRQPTVEKGENDEPTIVADSARMESVISKINQLFHTGRRGVVYPMRERTDGDDEWKNAFAEGRVLFDICIVGEAVGLRNYDINFGILPMPKYDTNQERYGSWVDPWGMLMCVPSDCPNPERTGIITETLSYYSYRLIYPAVLEQVIYGTGTRDIESVDMLNIIYDNMFFDFGFIYDSNGTGYGDIIRSLVPMNLTDIASYVAEKRRTVETHFGDMYQAVLTYYG